MIKVLTIPERTTIVELDSFMSQPLPEILTRNQFYERTMPSVAAMVPGYQLETGFAFLGLVSIYDRLTSHFDRRLSSYRLTLASFNVLMILNSPTYRETGCPMSQLGELLLVSKANVTGLTDTLERKGLVKRVNADYDRRVKLIRITEEGRALLTEVAPWHFQEVNRVAAHIPLEQRAQLVVALRNLNDQIGSALEADDDGPKK